MRITRRGQNNIYKQAGYMCAVDLFSKIMTSCKTEDIHTGRLPLAKRWRR
ncbi:hypothetical protein Lferr_2734 [Acidithiobacillus ferrooxidans ATCC 53993]|jgi:hypothetical protein|nr:hypothetical protein Lferr_2734 [Acidithiobacillus ferrooxidans ATCC 53993]BDB15777.1 hypothetical protein ANFP_30970 [Acidithiobacillus ferrooxidans]